MCEGRTPIAICACGASFAGCDTIEALLHITQDSGLSHEWVFLDTGVWQSGRLIDPPNPNPANYKEYLQVKYSRAKTIAKSILFAVVFLSSIAASSSTAGAHNAYHGHDAEISNAYSGRNHTLDGCRYGWYMLVDRSLYTIPERLPPPKFPFWITIPLR